MAEKIVVFGAGSTGRGHVGLLAWQAGYEIVFVDKDRELIKALKQSGKYRVRLFGRTEQDIEVCGFKVYFHQDRQTIAKQVAEAALVLTAVFDQNLPDVAQTLALAVAEARSAGRDRPLNCIACENMMDSSSTLGRHVKALLDGEMLTYCEQYFGFPDCMISRVVPRAEPDPLLIVAEDYNEWTVRAEHFKGDKPAGLDAMELVNNQTARLERKLFIHNGGHAVCGYMGFHRGHRYIHEAVTDKLVAEHVLGALDELGEVIIRRHGFSRDSVRQYEQDLCRRGAVPQMKDSILRVVRDPIRKLSAHERLVAPALAAVDYGLPRRWIVKGIVAALKYKHPGDAQSVSLAEQLASQPLPNVLRSICGIDADSPLVGEIQEEYRAWNVEGIPTHGEV